GAGDQQAVPQVEAEAGPRPRRPEALGRPLLGQPERVPEDLRRRLEGRQDHEDDREEEDHGEQPQHHVDDDSPPRALPGAGAEHQYSVWLRVMKRTPKAEATPMISSISTPMAAAMPIWPGSPPVVGSPKAVR